MVNDQIADLLTRIRNAQRVRHPLIRVAQSKMVERVLVVLKDEGFIQGYELKTGDSPFPVFVVHLRYYENGTPVVSECRRVSRSGRRVYVQADSLTRVKSGLGVSIVSTSQGVMSDREARRRKIGGELLAVVS